jgi:hypothetical protein
MADIITIGFPYVDYVLWTLIIAGLLVLALWGSSEKDSNNNNK